MNILQNPTQNFNSKDKNGKDLIIVPTMIVIHWTAGHFYPAVNWMKNPASKVSAHFCIDASGEIVHQLVDLKRRAWHCGGSWHELFSTTDSNLWTIGIECEGQPSLIGAKGWSDSFISSLIDLCKFIKEKVPSIIGIVDHSTIDPAHKQDVKKGKGIDLFPWDKLIAGVSVAGITDLTIEPYATNIKKHFNLIH